MAESSDTKPPKAGGQRGGGRQPVDPKTKAKIRALGRKGEMSRNAIAKECGVSTSTVTKVCAEAKPPITFDRSATAAAVEARSLDLKLIRTDLAEQTAVEAQRLLKLLTSPHEITHWDTKTGWLVRDTIELPTSGDVKNYAIALGILIDKHAVLVKFDSDDRDLPAVDAWLAEMMQAGVTVEMNPA